MLYCILKLLFIILLLFLMIDVVRLLDVICGGDCGGLFIVNIMLVNVFIFFFKLSVLLLIIIFIVCMFLDSICVVKCVINRELELFIL